MGSGSSKIGRENLYDLLGVENDAAKSELKQAYRRKALELHPDRNFQKEEEVTSLFARVQAAYDLLNNADDREWYDLSLKNRSTKYETYDSNRTSAVTVRKMTDLELLSKPAEDPLDFNAIQSYFNQLKIEEQEAAFELGRENPAVVLAPSFGLAKDSWASVKPFYDAWSEFSTVKEFEWEDIYPTSAQNKQTQRRYQQQNKKLREAAKSEFNVAVRKAILHLKQRDPRRPLQKSGSVPSVVPSNTRKEREQTPNGRSTLLLGSRESLASSNGDVSADKPAQQLPGLDTEEKPKKLGKAKAKLQRKKQGHSIVLTCGTCGVEFSGPDLIAHKKVTRHP